MVAGGHWSNIIFKEKQTRRTPSFEAFFYGGMAASPFARDIMALDDLVQNEILRSIEKSLLNYIDDDGLAAPIECYVLSARK